MDMTGEFPVRSSRGNQYILVAYNYDANAILAEPIKNKQAKTITTAYEKMHRNFIQAGVAPHTWVLHNERSGEIESAFEKYDVK